MDIERRILKTVIEIRVVPRWIEIGTKRYDVQKLAWHSGDCQIL